MGALLALISSKDWLWATVLVAAGILGLHYHHKILAEGIADQKAADDKQTAALVASTAKQTAELQAKATMAEQAYDKEVNSLTSLPVPSVRLCIYPHPSSGVVPSSTPKVAGDAHESASAGNIQPVPSGDSGGGGGTAGRDIGGMLSALARAADRSDAALREFQSR